MLLPEDTSHHSEVRAMALTEKHRRSIYRSLAPLLGEEEADAMLAQFASRGSEEPATKADLGLFKAELDLFKADMRTDLHREIGSVRAEIGSVRTEIGSVRTEMRSDLADEIGSVRSEISSVRTEIESVRTEIERSSKRTIIWLSGVMLAVGAMTVTGFGIAVAALA